MNVLFVCAGNTCRSPMAEAMFNEEAGRRGRAHRAKSAGLCPWPGDVAATDTVAELRRRGMDIEGRPAVQLDQGLVQEADLILAMTDTMADMMRQSLPNEAGKVQALCAYCGQDGEVSDPYGCDEDVYRATADQIQGLVSKVLDRLDREG